MREFVCHFLGSSPAMCMKITFVLPGAARWPSGGSRMVFRYSNALVAMGCSVRVIMPSNVGGAGPAKTILRSGRYLLWKLSGAFAPRRWFALDSRVTLSWVPNLAAAASSRDDAVIATSVRTAEAVAAWPESAGRKFYFVQGFETWDFSADRVRASWLLPLVKIAVSHWLGDLIAAAGSAAVILPNGADPDAFGIDVPIEGSARKCLLWPHHWLAQKGSDDVQAIVPLLKSGFPGIEVRAFGTTRPPRAWPHDVEYVLNPSQPRLRELYNQAAVMIAPSHEEGWGLPASEALQCGCGLVATDIGGHREFLRHEQNALLFPPTDRDALARDTRRLLSDPGLRLRLARQGVADLHALRFEPIAQRLRLILSGEMTL